MTFIRNFNKNLLKKCEMSLTSKKELRVLKTVVVKQKEDTGFYKIKRFFSANLTLNQSENFGQFQGFLFDHIKY